MKNKFVACGLFFVSSVSFAQSIQSTSFTKDDWEIYCSNTGTCRAAGYQSEDSHFKPASILLTRQAGANTSTKVEFVLADGLYGEDADIDLKRLNHIHLWVNDRDIGAVAVDGTGTPIMGQLSKSQVDVLLKAATQHSRIVFKNKNYTWQISDDGMSAVLLKMDDFQKRVGTVGALIKKGTLDESQVLQAQPKLQVTKVKTAEKPYLTLTPKSKQYAAVDRLLMSAKNRPKDEDFCQGIYDGHDKPQKQSIDLYKLTGGKVLATTLCWRGAYNEGVGAWVIDQSLTGNAQFITESASDFDKGEIFSAQKGRGIGDCWSTAEWIWDGKTFVAIQDRWSGMCKVLAAGGVWDLDLIESVVKK